jgi:hypothetical protein
MSIGICWRACYPVIPGRRYSTRKGDLVGDDINNAAAISTGARCIGYIMAMLSPAAA